MRSRRRDPNGETYTVAYHTHDLFVVKTTDPLSNEAETRVYGMLGQVLKVESEVSGSHNNVGDRWALSCATGEPLRAWDDRNHEFKFTYDELRRPVDRLVSTSGGADVLLDRTVYGELLASPDTTNHRGRVYRRYDGGGAATIPGYDFKGNATSQERVLPSSKTTRPDWTAIQASTTIAAMATAASSLLDSETFTASATFDALNRPLTATSPDNSEVIYSYNEAALLDRVEVKHRGSTTATVVIDHIDYDVKGRREEVEYGAGTTTTYAYDDLTYRVTRIRTAPNSAPNDAIQSLHYHYDPVGNIVEVRDTAQQTTYFQNTVVTPDTKFVYDPLYRLIESTGREHATQGTAQRGATQLVVGPQPDVTDPAAMRRYTQTYDYDEVGNILKMVHTPAVGTGWTRRYEYHAVTNRLLSTSAPGDPVNGPYTDTYSYDDHGNMTAMPHASSLVWNVDDEMLQADVGTESTYFQYADGQRVRKYCEKSGTTTEERIYVGPFEVYRKRISGSIDLEREALHISDDQGRMCLVETKTISGGSAVGTPVGIWRYQLSNHLGTSATEVDENGDVISYEEFHAYGTSAYRAADSTITTSTKRYRYTGKERDDETGLYYHGARYYAAWLGRWTAGDPIGLGDGVNRWGYVSGNPVRLHDPGGRDGEPGPLGEFVRWRLERARSTARAIGDAGRRLRKDAEELDREVGLRKDDLRSQNPDALRDPGGGAGPGDLKLLSFAADAFADVLEAPEDSLEGAIEMIESLGDGDVDGAIEGAKRATKGNLTLVGGGVAGGGKSVVRGLLGKMAGRVAARRAAKAAARRGVAKEAARGGTSNAAARAETAAGGGGTAESARVAESAPAAKGGVNVGEVLTKPESLWGRSADEIAAAFEEAGFGATVRQSTRGSARAQIVEVSGHPEITQIQVHPGGGRHSGAYYKISTSTEGKVKVVDPDTYKPTPDEKVRVVPFKGGSR